MKSRLNDLEAKEMEQMKSLEWEQRKHRQITDSFSKQHNKSGRDALKKRPWFHEARPTEDRTVQLNSVWTAKVNHIRSVMSGHDAESEEHLFTFPFVTTVNSLK